jgi:hypothetical protein
MKIEIKKPFKVVIVLVLCDADENRNKKNPFKVVSVPVLCDADENRNKNIEYR